MKRVLRMLLWSLPALAMMLALFLSTGLYTYHRLSDEALLAELRFERLDAQRYIATLIDTEGCQSKDYLIYGDQWRVDARFLKWEYWASLLGLDPLYRLERIEGRYRRSDDQNRLPTRAHDLGEAQAHDLLQMLERLGRYNIFFDASYGSSSYEAMDPERRYFLYRTQTGLMIRTMPVQEVFADEQGITIRISRACAEQMGLWQRVATATHGWLSRGLGG